MRILFASGMIIGWICCMAQDSETMLDVRLERDVKEVDQFRKDLFQFQQGNEARKDILVQSVEREVIQSKEQLQIVRRSTGETRVKIAEDLQLIREKSGNEKRELKKRVKTKVRVYNQLENVVKDLEKRAAYQIKLQEEINSKDDNSKIYRRLNFFYQTMIEDMGDRRLQSSLLTKVSEF